MPFIGRHQCNRALKCGKPILPIAAASLLALVGAPTAHAAEKINETGNWTVASSSSSWAVIFYRYYEIIWQILKRYYQPPPSEVNPAMAAMVDLYHNEGIPGDLLMDQIFALNDAATALLSHMANPPQGVDPEIAAAFVQVLEVLQQL